MKRVLIILIISIFLMPITHLYASMTINYNQSPANLPDTFKFLTVWGNLSATNMDERMYSIVWSEVPLIGQKYSTVDTISFPIGSQIHYKRDAYKDSYDVNWSINKYPNGGNWNGGDGYRVLYSNYDVRDISNNLVHESDVITDETYYIKDEAKIFNEEQKKKLYDMEKKWEKSGVQFFVITHNDNNDNQSKILQFGNTKTQSGHGILVISVVKKSDGSFMCGFAPSRTFIKHGYFEMPHFRYAEEFFYYLQRQDIRDTLDYRLNSILNNLINRDKEFKTEKNLDTWGIDDLIYNNLYDSMRDCKFYNLNSDGYVLKYNKLDYCQNQQYQLFKGKTNANSIDIVDDLIGFYDEDGVEYSYEVVLNKFDYYMELDDNHIWFSNIMSYSTPSPTPTNQYTPTPTFTPIPYKTPISTITSYTPIPLPEPPGAGIKWPSVTDEVYKKMPVGLIGSLYRLKELKTSPVPPVVSVNLYKLTKPISDRFRTGNSFEDKDTKILDFALLNDDIKFLGIGILTWFRTVLGSLFIWFTLCTFKDRLTPKEPLGG